MICTEIFYGLLKKTLFNGTRNLKKYGIKSLFTDFLKKNTLEKPFSRFSKFFRCLGYVIHAPFFRINIRRNQHWGTNRQTFNVMFGILTRTTNYFFRK